VTDESRQADFDQRLALLKPPSDPFKPTIQEVIMLGYQKDEAGKQIFGGFYNAEKYLGSLYVEQPDGKTMPHGKVTEVALQEINKLRAIGAASSDPVVRGQTEKVIAEISEIVRLVVDRRAWDITTKGVIPRMQKVLNPFKTGVSTTNTVGIYGEERTTIDIRTTLLAARQAGAKMEDLNKVARIGLTHTTEDKVGRDHQAIIRTYEKGHSKLVGPLDGC
jgi:hypothetical protein